MRKLEISKRGEDDLETIRIYYSKYYETTSNKIIRRMFQKFEILQQFPAIGNKLRNRFDIESDEMYTCCLKYMIIYQYTDDTVFIERILSSRTNFIKELF